MRMPGLTGFTGGETSDSEAATVKKGKNKDQFERPRHVFQRDSYRCRWLRLRGLKQYSGLVKPRESQRCHHFHSSRP